MTGSILYAAHRAFQRIGQCFTSSGDDLIIQRIRSREAWAKWQRRVADELAAARAKHQPIRPIQQRQTQTLHAALAAKPNHGAHA